MSYPKYFYKAKIRHKLTNKVEIICLMSDDDQRMLEQARAFAKLMRAKVIKVYGKKLLDWTGYKLYNEQQQKQRR